MPLTPTARAELERRGVSNVRALLSDPRASGFGQGAEVSIELPGERYAPRADIERWLAEKEVEAETLARQRFERQLVSSDRGARWAMLAFWASMASIVVMIAIWAVDRLAKL